MDLAKEMPHGDVTKPQRVILRYDPRDCDWSKLIENYKQNNPDRDPCVTIICVPDNARFKF